MNFIKRHFLQRELLSLEAKMTRYYALSSWKIELEAKQGSIIKKLCNGFLLHRANIEYDSLSPNIPKYESRIYEIKSQLREY